MFLYYIPDAVNSAEPTRESLQAGPLGSVFWDLLHSQALYDARIRVFTIHSGGPDGLSGRIVAAMPAAGLTGPPPGIRAGQTWQRVLVPADGTKVPHEYWIGYDRLPLDLRREYLVPGIEHELGDGQIWECPIVRKMGVQCNLPSKWGIDPQSGEFRALMLPRYQSAWDSAGKIFDAQLSGNLTKLDAVKLCAEMLGVNYRVGWQEISILGLLDDTTWKHVWRAATDAEFVESWLESQGDASKKNSRPGT